MLFVLASSASVVGIDPPGARMVAAELAGAEEALALSARRVRALLAEAGADDTIAGTVASTAAWCGETAADLRRRAGSAEEVQAEAARALAPLGDPVGGAHGQAGSGTASRLLVLLGAGRGAWLAREFPEVADRRGRAAGVVAELVGRRQALAGEVQRCALSPAQAAMRASELDNLIAVQWRRGIATPAEVGSFVASMSNAEVRRLGVDMARALPMLRLDDAERASLAAALVPLRRRVQDQVAPLAADLYSPGGSGDLGQAGELASVVQALRLRSAEDRGGSALSAFVGGLVAGETDGRGYRQGWLETWRQIGHTVSGLVMVGDVRDGVANLWRGEWGGAAFSAAALVPIAGDGAKALRNAARAGDGAAVAATRAARRVSLGSIDLDRRVDDAIERARTGVTGRFPKHDGKVFENYANAVPARPEGYYTEWTAADAGKRRELDRIVVGGDPRTPDVIYYWDHASMYRQIYP